MDILEKLVHIAYKYKVPHYLIIYAKIAITRYPYIYKMKSKKILKNIAFICFIGILLVGGNFLWNEYQVQQSEKKGKALYDQILEGASIAPTNITIDYKKQHSIGSPLIFGGAQYPNAQEDTVWDMLEEVGVTSMRTDFYLENMVPYTTNLEDYKNNKDNVQDTKNWRLDFIQTRKDAYINAKKHGMVGMGIMSYAPTWLTYTGGARGVPKDWDVYEDVVKKAYEIHRNNISYLELWNEPTHHEVFLDVTDSGMTPEEAYVEIFYHAAKAIREVDAEKNDGKKVLLGGPASDNPRAVNMLEAILKDERTRKQLDFMSYHNYHISEPSWDAHKAVLKKYRMEHLPIYLTEWNYKPETNEDSPYKTSYPAILFTANKLVDFLKMGLAGANYYSLLRVEEVGQSDYPQYLAFYRINNGNVELLPQARSWRLLSKKMGLGEGISNIMVPQKTIDDLNIIGFTNDAGQQGVVIINNSTSPQSVSINLINSTQKNYVKFQAYYASAYDEAKEPVYKGLLKEKDGLLNFSFFIPEETVMGVFFGEEKAWFDISNLFK